MEQNNLTDRIIKLEMALYGIEQSNLNPHAENQSFEVAELATAFAKAQGEYNAIGQNRTNPYFKSKYADLDSILKAVRPALTKNGLSFYQYTSIYKGETLLHSRILHASGQWLESQIKINPPKNDIQSFGSTMSYQRRYSALTILGVATSEDPSDDDGTSVTNGKITTHDVAAIKKALGANVILEKAILKKYALDSLSQMRNDDFSTIMAFIKKYKEQ